MCSNCVMLLIWTKISEDFFWQFVPFMPERIEAFLWQKGKSNKVSGDCISTLCVCMLYIFTMDSPLNAYIGSCQWFRPREDTDIYQYLTLGMDYTKGRTPSLSPYVSVLNSF